MAMKLGEIRKEKKLKSFTCAIFASLLLFTTIGTIPLRASALEEQPIPELKYENIRITSENQVVNISDKVDELAKLEEGTILIRYRTYNKSSLMDLFSVSNSKVDNGYYALYVNPSNGKVGFEARNQSQVGGTTTPIASASTAVSNISNNVNTIALKVDKSYGYKIFYNGALVSSTPSSTVKFFNGVVGADSAVIGKIFRGGTSSANSWVYNGDIDFVNIYNVPLADDYLISKTSETNVSSNEVLPPGAVKTMPIDITYPGFLNSNYFRIPSMISTKTGKVITGLDIRYNSAGDTPNHIDIGIRTSNDEGKTWDNGKEVLHQSNKGSAIDSSLLQDNTTGRIYMAVDIAPDGYAFGNSAQGSGYETINGVRYLNLYDSSNNKYTVRENGVVFSNNGIQTNYTMNNVEDIFLNDIKVGNAFSSSSPLKVLGSFYVKLIYSDDDGVTWSNPIDITGQTKQDWMKFFGTGPGRGLQHKVGPYAGRLVFPIYYTNVNGKQSSALIYSDDHGTTWKLGESPNDGRIEGSTTINSQTLNTSTYELTESQVVEMPDGQLKLFCRNYGGKVSVATSFDGGATWDDTVEKDVVLTDPYCQLSVINYSEKIDGYDALIFSNPNSTSRANGTIRVGLIKDSGTTYTNGRTRYTFDWKYSKSIKQDAYGYSCLTELPNGNIGVFYEGTGNQVMSFTQMNVDYLKYVTGAKTPLLTSIQLIENKKTYNYGDTIGVKFSFDERVIAIGQRSLNIQIGDNTIPLTMTQSEDGKELIFQGQIDSLPTGPYVGSVVLPTALEVFNVYGNKYINDGNTKSLGIMEIVNKSTLSEAILDAETKQSEAVVGVEEGEYPQDAMDKLESAIESAKVVNDNVNSTQANVDAEVTELNNAVAVFQASVITKEQVEERNVLNEIDKAAETDKIYEVQRPEDGISISAINKAAEKEVALKFELSEVTVILPAGIFDEDKLRNKKGKVVLTQSSKESEQYSTASDKLKIVGKVYDFSLRLINGETTEDIGNYFAKGKKARVNIKFSEEELKNVKDTSKLLAYNYNEDTNKWKKTGGDFNKATNSFNFDVEHFSIYSIFEKVKK